MPIITEQTVERGRDDGVCGPVEGLLYGETGRLTQFGALVEILPPGSRSSLKHWHAAEDEMVLVLEGELLLHEGDKITPFRAGEVATFKAGEPVGHCLENASDAPARYLIIGTRARTDTITYPDHRRVCHIDRAAERYEWTDLDGNPASNAYEEHSET